MGRVEANGASEGKWVGVATHDKEVGYPTEAAGRWLMLSSENTSIFRTD